MHGLRIRCDGGPFASPLLFLPVNSSSSVFASQANSTGLTSHTQHAQSWLVVVICTCCLAKSIIIIFSLFLCIVQVCCWWFAIDIIECDHTCLKCQRRALWKQTFFQFGHSAPAWICTLDGFFWCKFATVNCCLSFTSTVSALLLSSAFWLFVCVSFSSALPTIDNYHFSDVFSNFTLVVFILFLHWFGENRLQLALTALAVHRKPVTRWTD